MNGAASKLTGGLTSEEVVRVTSTNAAQILGTYSRKGFIGMLARIWMSWSGIRSNAHDLRENASLEGRLKYHPCHTFSFEPTKY
jgi:hypothetical protein